MQLPTLTDGVVTLRPRRPEDADAIVAACQEPEIFRWTRVPSPYTRAHAEEWLAQSDPSQARLLAVDADDRLPGSFSVMEIDRGRGYGEIGSGYWVAARAGFRPTGETRPNPRDPSGEAAYDVYVWRA